MSPSRGAPPVRGLLLSARDMNRRVALLLLAAALAPLPAAGASKRCGDDVDGRAVACDCGDVLVSGRTLTAADPITRTPCAGNGLLVRLGPEHRGATLALGGQTIGGSGAGDGILVLAAEGLTILGPGTIRRFDAGVRAQRGGLAQIAGVLAADNRTDGFSLGGQGYRVVACEAIRNGRDGFVLGGSRYQLEGSTAVGNGRHGFGASGREASATGNTASDNGGDGLVLRGRRHAADTPDGRGNHGAPLRRRGDRCDGGVPCR